MSLGTGHGISSSLGASGGSHGGRGGHGVAADVQAGLPYGTIYTPGTSGSGGGSGQSASTGGRGGGYIHAEVQGTATIYGQVTANGQDGQVLFTVAFVFELQNNIFTVA